MNWSYIQKKMESPGWKRQYDKVKTRIDDRPWVGVALLFASALLGFPPLAIMAVFAGQLKFNPIMFYATVFVGRTLRFAAVLGGVDLDRPLVPLTSRRASALRRVAPDPLTVGDGLVLERRPPSAMTAPSPSTHRITRAPAPIVGSGASRTTGLDDAPPRRPETAHRSRCRRRRLPSAPRRPRRQPAADRRCGADRPALVGDAAHEIA